jgi:alkanesulfonate monooxygenase SsuD/methylene tetrahydromethanopterin reductase-like flavin-dependent oxidoreductase (luciferase family)
MDVGIVTLPTDESVPLDVLAVAAEERGFASLLVGDHTHIPARRTTPFIAGDRLPDEYYRLVDPFVALATAASRTSTIKLGTCIFLIAQRDPISTAKQVASLDYVSKGRFVFGIGYGWNVEEAADHGVEWATRRRRIREYVAAMKSLWTDEEATFHGDFVNFDDRRCSSGAVPPSRCSVMCWRGPTGGSRCPTSGTRPTTSCGFVAWPRTTGAIRVPSSSWSTGSRPTRRSSTRGPRSRSTPF